MGIFAQAKKAVDWFTATDTQDGEYVDDYGYISDDDVEIRTIRKVQPVKAGIMHSIVTLDPTSYEDAQHISQALREGKTTTLNLTRLTKEEARRIVDFATGVVAGIDGAIDRIHPFVFILTPPAVEITASEEF